MTTRRRSPPLEHTRRAGRPPRPSGRAADEADRARSDVGEPLEEAPSSPGRGAAHPPPLPLARIRPHQLYAFRGSSLLVVAPDGRVGVGAWPEVGERTDPG